MKLQLMDMDMSYLEKMLTIDYNPVLKRTLQRILKVASIVKFTLNCIQTFSWLIDL